MPAEKKKQGRNNQLTLSKSKMKKDAGLIIYTGAAVGIVLGFAYAVRTGREIAGLNEKAHKIARDEEEEERKKTKT